MLKGDIANVVIATHVISSSDHTSWVYGHCKKPLMKKPFTDPEARELLVQVGDQPKLHDRVKCDMEMFLLTKIYRFSGRITCAQARADKWHKQK